MAIDKFIPGLFISIFFVFMVVSIMGLYKIVLFGYRDKIEISNWPILLVFMISIFFTVGIYKLDFDEHLTKEQVQKAVEERFSNQHVIRRISFRKGGLAGDVGFYFVEFDSNNYIIIVDDARLPITWSLGSLSRPEYFMEGRPLSNILTFIEYYDHHFNRGAYMGGYRKNKTWSLQYESLLNFLLGKKNENQLFWERY
jgi:hypothetical protein